jgi:O-antigen/teichoic acid export membrane protein
MSRDRYLRAFLVKGLSVAALFGAQVLLARTVEEEGDYGFYNFLISILNLLSLAVVWGMDKLLVREVAVDLEGRGGRFHALVRGAGRLTAGHLVLALPVLAGILWWARPGRWTLGMVLAAWLLLVGMCYARTGTAVLRGMGQVLRAEAVLNLLRPVAFAAGLGIAFLLAGPRDAASVVGLGALAFVLAGAAAFLAWRRGAPPADPTPVAAPPLRRTGFPFLAIGIGLPMLANLDIILLGVLGGDRELAPYSAAARLVILATLGLTAANLLIAPRLAVLHDEGKLEEMQRMLRRHNLVILCLTLAPVAVLALAGDLALALFGESYRAGFEPLRILLLGQLVNVLVGPVNLVCMMAGEQRLAGWTTMGACVVLTALCYLLVPTHGPVGAAWASAIALGGMNLAQAAIVIRRVGVDPTVASLLPRLSR